MLNLSIHNLHHAYALEEKSEEDLVALDEFIEKEMGTPLRGNPDFFKIKVDTFGIDEARSLKIPASFKAVTIGKKVFVICARVITDQAQNALLKLLEEPTPGTHFFLVIPNLIKLLPTLRSRVIPITNNTSKETPQSDSNIKLFINATPAKRFDIVTEIIKEKSKDEDRGLIKGRATQFLAQLEIYLHKTLDMEKLSPEEQLFFTELIQTQDYLQDQGSSLKLLLEHITLFLPRY
jgi:DNA polymerase III delta prime subunit